MAFKIALFLTLSLCRMERGIQLREKFLRKRKHVIDLGPRQNCFVGLFLEDEKKTNIMFGSLT